MKKKRARIIIATIIISIIFLLPIPYKLRDGGTVVYKAILYRITFWHSIDENYESGFYEDTELKIFPFNYFD